MLTPKEIAYEVTKALDAKKGQNIKLLKIDRVSSLADYFLICTGTSNTHVKTLCDYAEYTLEQLGEQMLSREGHRGNSWELLDYGSIVVHVFTEEARKFYDLERLWADAELVDIRDIANLELIADKILKVVSDLRMLCENLHRAQEIFPAAARRAEEIETFFKHHSRVDIDEVLADAHERNAALGLNEVYHLIYRGS